MGEIKKFLLMILLGAVLGVLLSYAFPVAAKRPEPIPVYVDPPPHKRPYISTADKNRLYSARNPIRRVDPEVKKYLEQKQKEEVQLGK